SDKEAHEFIDRFYRLRIREDGEIGDYLGENVSLLAPGDPTLFPFSGVWLGKDEVCEFFNLHKSLLTDREVKISKIIANNDSIAVVLEESGKLADNGEAVHLKRYELIQLVGYCKIGRISIYMDTYPLTQKL
ncbi:MAG: nuclear transport factor 2 family protein, partial [Nitrospirota bacterium]|nr:nuclear transport factor 2 family protein [Nitrospirota bacterium]